MLEALAVDLRAYDNELIKKANVAAVVAPAGRAVSAMDLRLEQGVSGCEMFRGDAVKGFVERSSETYQQMAHVLVVNAAAALDAHSVQLLLFGQLLRFYRFCTFAFRFLVAYAYTHAQ